MSLPVTDLNSDYLKVNLKKVISKIAKKEFKLIPIIINELSMNVKVARSLLHLEKDNIILLLRRYSTSFNLNGVKYFILFCSIYVLKYIWNNLLTTNNYFKYLELILPNSKKLEARVFNIRYIKQLYKDEIKEKFLMSKVTFIKKVVYLTKLEQ